MPEQAVGEISLGFGIVVELMNFHVGHTAKFPVTYSSVAFCLII